MSIIYMEEELPLKCKLSKNANDFTGQHLYNLTFLYPCRDNNNNLKWICKCDCGRYVEVFSKNVLRGNTKSCGCLKRESPPMRKDLTGQRFGKLKVIGNPQINPKSKGGTLWQCKCDCGNIVYKESLSLIHGHTKSCGCLKAELHSTMNDLTNQHFGNLTALYTEKVSKDGERIWHCKCTCGNETDVRAGALRSGKTQSCGCKTSKNNCLIEKILSEKNIPYKKEYSFKDLYISNPKGKLKFDFAIFNSENNLQFLIEYQGFQHFNAVDFFGGKDGYNKQVIRDEKKKQYCKKNNIKLYEITYLENTEEKLNQILKEENIN